MQIFGYNDATKDLELTDIPVEEIVSSDFDPWCMDVFDRWSVSRRGSGLRFNRLHDACFAFAWGSKIFVGIADEHGRHGFEGNSGPFRAGPLEFITDLQSSSHSFDSLLTEYLYIRDNKGMSAWCSPEEIRHHRNLMFASSAGKGLFIEGNQLAFDRRSSRLGSRLSNNPTFRGEMYGEVSLGAINSPEIHWLYKNFGDLNPVVTGTGLRRALKGERVEFLECLVDHDDSWSTGKFGGRVSALNLRLKGTRTVQHHKECIILGKFEHAGCTYFARGYDGDPIQQSHDEGCWSADTIYAFGPDHVLGSRIAAFDLGSGRARKLSGFEESDFSLWKKRREQLELDGFEMIALANPVEGSKGK